MKRKEGESTNPIQTSRSFDLLGGADSFLSLDNNQRIARLSEYAKKAHTSDMPGSRKLQRAILDKNLGLLVIKPEAFEGKSMAINFLRENYGITPIVVKDFIYTLEKYLSIYLKTIETYPDSFSDILAPLIYHHTTKESSAIIFAHAEGYREAYRKRFNIDPTGWLATTNPDSVSDFKRIVVGSGSNPAPHSLRRELGPLIEKDGYYTFNSDSAMTINIESRLQHRSILDNQITFNGVHSPESNSALIECISTIFETREVKGVCM